MSDPGSIVETIFMGARQLSRAEERAAYLDQKCGGDPALRERVERLLNAEQKADHFLANDPLQIEKATVMDSSQSEGVGRMIGPYKLLQQIGEGGCGIVYMAEQEEPIRRRVALKVIKPGMDTRQVIARFEAERQALAMMDHPNIARILDAGVTGEKEEGRRKKEEGGSRQEEGGRPTSEGRILNEPGESTLPSSFFLHTSPPGRPYFVMELVRGIRITDYCDQNNLPTRERLDLFTKVVQAVQHAHQKGVIHRDLKPSNVLITLHDGLPVPKVIDFGIAKALEQKLTDMTLFTRFEMFLGTPAYTSPEQAEMSGLDIDTRSDIYSLGVLLYELLVGKTPFDAHHLVHSGLDEMRRIIREQEPSRPSTLLTKMVQGEVTTTAQRRRVSAPELIHLVKGDLDWIVMKCLEKDRTRRYETANGLAADIQHYLSNEPVTARPPSQVYRFSKLVRRNKLAFTAGAVVAVALVAGTVVSTWQAVRAQRAERAAKEQKDSAEAVLQFFRDNVLTAGRPEGSGSVWERRTGLGKDVTLRQALEAAEAEIGKSFTNRPLVEAAIRTTLGESYHNLGESTLAIPQLGRAVALRRRVLGLSDQPTIHTMYLLGTVYREAGMLDQARPLQEEVIQLAKARLEADSSDPRWKRLHSLASAYATMGRFDQSIPLYEESLKLERAERGPDHPDVLWAMHYLAENYKETGRIDQALALCQDVLRLRKARLGSTHPDTFWAMHYLANAYAEAGSHDQALALNEEALQLRKVNLGVDHPDTLWSMLTLAFRYSDAGRLDQAVPLHEEVIRLRQKKLGPDHPATITSIKELALTYFRAREYALALPLYERAFEQWTAKLGPDHPDTIDARHDIGVVHWHAGRIQQALPHLEEATHLRKTKLGTERPETLWGMNRLARLYRDAGMLDQALALFEETLRVRKATLGPTHRDTEETLMDLAELHYRQRQYDQSEPLYRELVRSRRARLHPEHQDVIDATASLGRLLADRAWAERSKTAAAEETRFSSYERAREAERLLRECLAMRLCGTNHTSWRSATVPSLLGGALVSVAVTDPALDAASREASLAEAETLLLEGSRRLQQVQPADGNDKRDALERLTRLYEAWNKPEQRAEWQQQLDAFDEKPKA